LTFVRPREKRSVSVLSWKKIFGVNASEVISIGPVIPEKMGSV
jgi:hypothetical protein